MKLHGLAHAGDPRELCCGMHTVTYMYCSSYKRFRPVLIIDSPKTQPGCKHAARAAPSACPAAPNGSSRSHRCHHAVVGSEDRDSGVGMGFRSHPSL